MNLSKLELNRFSTIRISFILFFITVVFLSVYLAAQHQIIQKTAAAGPAILSLSPNTGSYNKNQNFDINILLNTGDKPVVGIDVSLTFDPAILQIQAVNPGSLFQNQIVFKNETSNNRILLSLGSFTPFTGSGTYGTIKFLATGIGNTQVGFDTTSTKIAQQGGGDILGETIGGSYVITESVSPTSTPTSPLLTSTPSCLAERNQGDYDCNGQVNEDDYKAWLADYKEGKTVLSYYEYWRRAFYR